MHSPEGLRTKDSKHSNLSNILSQTLKINFTGLCKSVHPWGHVSEIQSIKETLKINLQQEPRPPIHDAAANATFNQIHSGLQNNLQANKCTLA